MTELLSVHNPCGYPPKVTGKRLANRLQSLDGKVVYLVDCLFDNSAHFIEQLRQWFEKNMPKVETRVICPRESWVDDPDAFDPYPTVEQFEVSMMRLARRVPDFGVPHRPTGLAALYDVADKTTASRETLGVDYMIAVRRERKATQTSSTMEVNKSVGSVAGDAAMTQPCADDGHTYCSKPLLHLRRAPCAEDYKACC